jgi:hypothetical protein
VYVWSNRTFNISVPQSFQDETNWRITLHIFRNMVFFDPSTVLGPICVSPPSCYYVANLMLKNQAIMMLFHLPILFVLVFILLLQAKFLLLEPSKFLCMCLSLLVWLCWSNNKSWCIQITCLSLFYISCFSFWF